MVILPLNYVINHPRNQQMVRPESPVNCRKIRISRHFRGFSCSVAADVKSSFEGVEAFMGCLRESFFSWLNLNY